MNIFRRTCFGLLASVAAATGLVSPLSAQQQKPNILVIMGDDIGYWNISAYNRGMMGYRTPNIDRIANEGADLHRLLWAAILHRRSRRLYHRTKSFAHRAAEGRPSRQPRKACPARIRPLPSC